MRVCATAIEFSPGAAGRKHQIAHHVPKRAAWDGELESAQLPMSRLACHHVWPAQLRRSKREEVGLSASSPEFHAMTREMLRDHPKAECHHVSERLNDNNVTTLSKILTRRTIRTMEPPGQEILRGRSSCLQLDMPCHKDSRRGRVLHEESLRARVKATPFSCSPPEP